MSDKRPEPEIHAQPPAVPDGGTVGSPAKSAGGVTAVLSSLRHIRRETGLFSGSATLLKLNSEGGVDCPGCAWPEPEHRSFAEFCENGAKAIAEETTSARVDAAFFARHSVHELSTWSDMDLGRSGRITQPFVRRGRAPHYEPIEWDEAFSLIGDQLSGLDNPNEAVFYTSGRTSNEAAFLYQLFVRAYGTNNMPDCSNMCHESSGTGLGETIGIGKGTVRLEDFVKSDLILIFGQNPGTNHPRMLTTLQAAKRAGATIVSVNPLIEPGLVRFKHPQEVSGVLGRGTTLSDDYFQVRINGDVALINGIIKAVLDHPERDALPGFDEQWIRANTTGFAELTESVARMSWRSMTEGSGIDRDRIEALAERVLRAESMICCWAMGLTQHKNGVGNIQSVSNLLLLGGNFGRPGAGACPVRGHSNVQGDRTVGIWERPTDAFLNRLGDAVGFAPPREHGLDVVGAIEAMDRRQASVFVAMGGNFISATPDTERTARALQRCSLTVQISTKLNRSHLITGDTALILPCLGRTDLDTRAGVDNFVTVENSMGYVHPSRGHRPPPSEHLLSEPEIVARIAAATLGPNTPIRWMWHVEDYDRIRHLLGQAIAGFDNFNERLQESDGFYLPNVVHEGGFGTDDGKAHFVAHAIPEEELEDDQLMMMTIRSHDQFNTTIYGLNDRYRGIRNERRVVMMNPDDIDAMGLEIDQHVDLLGPEGDDGEPRRAENFRVMSYDLPRKSCATYFPEANPLVPLERFAKGSRTPASKSVPIRIARRGLSTRR